MDSSGSVVRDIRSRATLSLRDLAELAGTSSATLSNYETGRKDPRLSTVARLAEAAGYDLVITLRPRLTDQERRSLALGRAVADKIRSDPEAALRLARRNLARQRGADPDGHAVHHHDAWQALLDGPVEALASMLETDAPIGRELRPTAPFAGLLDDTERDAAVAGALRGADT